MTSFKSKQANCQNTILGKIADIKSYEAILITMHSEQCEHLYFKFSEAYMKYRQVVAEWMVDVAVYFNLHPTTTHAAVAYLDRLQPNEKFSRYEWQMLAICCLLISSKYNEKEESVPPLRRLEEITQQPVPNSTILNYELWALKRMGWKLNARVPMAFLTSYLSIGVLFPNDCYDSVLIERLVDTAGLLEMMEGEMTDLATKCILDVEFKHIPSSAIACAILYHVRAMMGIEPVWRTELTTLTGHNPITSKSVGAALAMFDVLQNVNASDSSCESVDDSAEQFVDSLIASTDALTLSPQSPAAASRVRVDSEDLRTPLANKENTKPLEGVLETSPTSIALAF